MLLTLLLIFGAGVAVGVIVKVVAGMVSVLLDGLNGIVVAGIVTV